MSRDTIVLHGKDGSSCSVQVYKEKGLKYDDDVCRRYVTFDGDFIGEMEAKKTPEEIYLAVEIKSEVFFMSPDEMEKIIKIRMSSVLEEHGVTIGGRKND